MAEEDGLKSVAVVCDKNLPDSRPFTAYLETGGKEDSPECLVGEHGGGKVKLESVNLDESGDSELNRVDEDGDDEDEDGVFKGNKQKKKRLKKKKPKHILIEDDSSSDDDAEKRLNHANVNPSDLTWFLWMWYYIRAASSGALRAAEFLGEKLAAFFGITTPKYQYVIDEYYRLKELEREEEERERKEQEFVAQRKMDELSKLEGGNQELVYNQVSSPSAHGAVS